MHLVGLHPKQPLVDVERQLVTPLDVVTVEGGLDLRKPRCVRGRERAPVGSPGSDLGRFAAESEDLLLGGEEAAGWR
jgi:hypothetical protein